MKLDPEKRRKNLGMSYADLARKTGMHPPTIWRILKKVHSPRLEHAQKLAKALGLGIESFIH